GRRLVGGGFLSRVPLRSPSTPPSCFNAAPGAKKTVYFPAYCSMVSGSWELGHGPPGDLLSTANLRRLAPPFFAYITPLVVANGRRIRLTRTGRCRIVVDGGCISNTLVSLSFVREQTIAAPAENPDAVPRVCPK